MKLLWLTLGLYLVLELLLHAGSWLVAKAMAHEARKRNEVLVPSRMFYQLLFYRLFAIITVALMGQLYQQTTNLPGWVQAIGVVVVIATVISLILLIDASLIQRLKKRASTSFVNMHEMELRYILRHLPQHRHFYFSDAFVRYARRANIAISVVAAGLLYVDLRAYFPP